LGKSGYGRLSENLKAAGYAPAEVDQILITHLLYTYIALFGAMSGFGGRVEALLLGFGVAAPASIWHTGANVDRILRLLGMVSLTLFIASSAAMALTPGASWIVGVAVIVWGFSFGGAATQLQTAAGDAAGDGVDLANAINATVWNGAIASGGLIGGALLQAGGPATLPMCAILFPGAALAICLRSHTHAFRPGPRRSLMT
jgi:predicted MFS family arabinose efflux permease